MTGYKNEISNAQSLPTGQQIQKNQKHREKGVYRYATSNAFNLGESKMDSMIKMQENAFIIPTLEAMADIYNEFDIIGLQELSTGQAKGGKKVKRVSTGAQATSIIVDVLNRKGDTWGMLTSDPTVGPGKESYAVIFRKSKFIELHAPHSGLIKELQDDIDREPYHAVLKEKSTGKLLHIYLFHLRPKTKKPGLEVEAVGRNPGAFEKENVIISGDFNLPHQKLNNVFEGILGLRHWVNKKTSLKEKEINGNYMAFEYDNIFTGNGINVQQTGILDFVPIVGNLDEARKISDHLIPWIEFRIK
ncbi:MAG: hypothetical protein PHY51_01885 [Candidatus Gracilibacteria bacterium]|nr:hypothetical protein [Candidatus Gracilibacteria bacterium]